MKKHEADCKLQVKHARNETFSVKLATVCRYMQEAKMSTITSATPALRYERETLKADGGTNLNYGFRERLRNYQSFRKQHFSLPVLRGSKGIFLNSQVHFLNKPRPLSFKISEI